jgi:phospholipid/cholesterol/gamma-HCH transport system ATP-binding protein
MSYAISIKDVTKRFKGQIVLNRVNLNVEEGSITTILGFSGAGKSTLIRHMLGLLTPDSGEIIVLGKDITKMSHQEVSSYRKNFGVLFQNAALFDSMSAIDNVAFPLRELTNMSASEISVKAKSLLLTVGIEDKSFNLLPAELSGGMRKRVGLARALVLGPQIMLYDEPTTGLDPITTKIVNNLILDTAKKNKGITSVIISHDVKASLKISDFIAFLDNGKLIEYAPADEFVNSSNSLIKGFLE